ncbi:MAG UNVERIFIED_CONTAM: serine protease [Rickettsiaceae bacterium]|jgi:S1-C subfamily serine protease
MHNISAFLLTILLPSIIYANELWDSVRFDGLARGKKYGISMGSGFFVNNNQIVTNRHVVSNCKNIAIRGAVKPTKATLIVLDTELDLALLYSPNSPTTIPYLRITL